VGPISRGVAVGVGGGSGGSEEVGVCERRESRQVDNSFHTNQCAGVWRRKGRGGAGPVDNLLIIGRQGKKSTVGSSL